MTCECESLLGVVAITCNLLHVPVPFHDRSHMADVPDLGTAIVNEFGRIEKFEGKSYVFKIIQALPYLGLPIRSKRYWCKEHENIRNAGFLNQGSVAQRGGGRRRPLGCRAQDDRRREHHGAGAPQGGQLHPCVHARAYRHRVPRGRGAHPQHEGHVGRVRGHARGARRRT